MRKILLSLFMCTSLTSCGFMQPVSQPETHRYQISIANSDSNSCSSSGAKMGMLQVEQMHALAPYDSKKIFYSTADYELSTYAYHQWVADPSQMLSQAVVENLLQSCIFDNVIGAEVMSLAKYRLASSLLELDQKIAGDKSTVNLSILVQLIDNNSNKVIKSKTFIETMDVAATPSGYTSGVNQATSKFLDDLRAWLIMKG